jgi:hypothetical protein
MSSDIDASYQFQGVTKMVQDSINVCDVDIRRELFGSSYFCRFLCIQITYHLFPGQETSFPLVAPACCKASMNACNASLPAVLLRYSNLYQYFVEMLILFILFLNVDYLCRQSKFVFKHLPPASSVSTARGWVDRFLHRWARFSKCGSPSRSTKSMVPH